MISVCMATYNGEKYIAEQLKSILAQLEQDDEVVVSDDRSTDMTLEIVESFNDKRIRVFTNGNEKGYTKNFEYALEQARGDIIILSDQDDVWMPERVKKTLESLTSHDFVVCDAVIVDSDLNVIYPSMFEFRNARKGFIVNLIQIKYLGCCMAFTRKVLNCSLPFPKKQKYVEHDAWLTLLPELLFDVDFLEVPLIKYRRHSENASLGGAKGKTPLLHKLKKRVYILYYLMKVVLSKKC